MEMCGVVPLAFVFCRPRDRMGARTVFFLMCVCVPIVPFLQPLEIPIDQDPFYFKNVPEMFGQAFVFMFSLASGMGTSMDEEDGELEESPISDVSKSNADVGMLKYRM